MPLTFRRDRPNIDSEARALLRSLAEAADHDRRRWHLSPHLRGYPQDILRVGDAVLVATTYESPDFEPDFGKFIAACSPPVVLALLDALDAAENPDDPA